MDGAGNFLPDTGLVGGMHVNEANNAIIEIMRENGALISVDKLEHSYPHCWRHKTPIIFRATPQWFFSMDAMGLREDALREIDKVKFIPAWGKQRIRGMVAERMDWCISRQRTWGVPITVFIHKETGALHPDTPGFIAQVAAMVEQDGIDAWFELDADKFLGADAGAYEKVSDTLDVWFDSGVTHFSVLAADTRLRYPADLYLEGSDQHRGWFQSSLLTSVGINRIAPFKSVLTHGFAVDAQGKKMSKSLGNTVEPQKVIKTLGADILRLWIAATDYRGEMNVSEEILKRMADAYRRIRNTARYLLANLDGFDPAVDCVQDHELLDLDRWILADARELQERIIGLYHSYEFHQIFQALHQYCGVTLSSFYIDIIKDRIYTMQKNSPARRSAQTVMYHITEAFVRWIAPILSFTADEIWRYIPGKRSNSVFLEDWYTGFPEVASHHDKVWSLIIPVRDEVTKQLEKLRAAGAIGSSLDAEVEIHCDGESRRLLDELEDELRFVFITSYARVCDAGSITGDAGPTSIDGIKIRGLASSHEKCVRCWHHREDVGSNAAHPELCGRCVENVAGTGEERRYA